MNDFHSSSPRPEATLPASPSPEELRAAVREKYGAIAEERASGCCGEGGCACGCGSPSGVMTEIGYTTEQIASAPEGADLGLGCGNPLAYASLQPGETVLDLGSGAGIDCFLAAREVGPGGRAIGVDMTASMVERARRNATQHGYANVEFRLGEIEHLPVADGSIDAVISNCVINLSADKAQVFREAYRALKPGGRLLVSDLVLLRPLSPELQRNVELYVGCVAGAALQDEYLGFVRAAGFEAVEVVDERRYAVGASAMPEGSPEREAFSAVVSVKVRALKKK
ncbi:MAG TPA: arsenite methyltransferase [Candidatus Limnocylindria bacterium]|nr:arsenite methyltransferase [Candidatus Limnocylindria bacterium]